MTTLWWLSREVFCDFPNSALKKQMVGGQVVRMLWSLVVVLILSQSLRCIIIAKLNICTEWSIAAFTWPLCLLVRGDFLEHCCFKVYGWLNDKLPMPHLLQSDLHVTRIYCQLFHIASVCCMLFSGLIAHGYQAKTSSYFHCPCWQGSKENYYMIIPNNSEVPPAFYRAMAFGS